MTMKSTIRRLLWYRNRLASMSADELLHRVSEQLKRSTSAYSTPDFSTDVNTSADLPVFPGLYDGLMKLADDSHALTEWADVAKRAEAGKLKLLGVEWPGNRESNRWSLDPVSHKHWPQDDYCFHIDYRHNSEFGDIKYVWEMNRLQYLQPIAALAAVNNDRALADFCANEIESWIDNNPPFLGVNWISGIELASRVVSMLTVTTLVGADSFDENLRYKLRSCLSAHGYWLMRYPSRFSSANNHLIAEAAALYLLGTLAPWLKNSNGCAEYGRTVLIEEVLKQIHADGVGAEQSPTYTAYSIEWLLLCGLIGKLHDQPFPDSYWQRIKLAGDFLRWITDSSGNQPRIGDDDEGRVFFSQSAPESYVSSVLGCLSSVTGNTDLAPPATNRHLREAFFGSTIADSSTLSGLRCFNSGGYTVSRSYQNGIESLLVFDHGPLGHLAIAAHGHADTLSIWLHLKGRPVLVDAGTFLYHSGGEWRDHMRGTSAHNTLNIEGCNSSIISGAFNWATKASASILSFESRGERWSLEAEHGGYNQRFGVSHRRRIEQREDGSFDVVDSLNGNARGHLPVEIGFLLHPDLEAQSNDNRWIVYDNGTPILEITNCSSSLIASTQYGIESPLGGWYSGAFSHKTPAKRLLLSGVLAINTACRISFRVL